MTLAEFLLARVAEDEAAARTAIMESYEEERWLRPNERGVVQVVDDGVWRTGDHAMDEARIDGIGITVYDEGGHTAEQARHIARWDPARVLADCEAKRRIVEEYAEAIAPNPNPYHGSNTGTPSDDGFYEGGWEDALKLACQCLALPYADHPEFREEWRP
jgi:hypothetical protein